MRPGRSCLRSSFILAGFVLLCASIGFPSRTVSAAAPPELLTGCWVAYAPTHFAPPIFYPTAADITADMVTLKNAGFTGIVTYGSEKILGQQLPALVAAQGLKLIMGIWNPDRDTSAGLAEYNNAVAAKNNVVGYVVGNEGLNNPDPTHTYSLAILTETMNQLKTDTLGKPVATSEQWEDYVNDPSLLDVGDWVFPNAHPYNQIPRITDSALAAQWTHDRFDQLDGLTARDIMFKEVGLPSSGPATDHLSPANQAEYFRLLRWETHTRFVYFEAFDQPWKHFIAPAEPYWGMFTAARAPKKARQYVCGGVPLLSTPAQGGTTTNNRPVFRWNNTGAAKYEMQLDTGTVPTQTVVDKLPVFSFTPGCPLLTRNYNWRVRAYDTANHAMDWSETRTITIQSSPTAAPSRNNFTISTSILTWNRISWATAYEIQLGCDLTHALHDDILPDDNLSYPVPISLPNGSYNWRIRARNSDGKWGNWSATEMFWVNVP
jgi:exo-beta-1,3-glucanase (GH17 family)